MEPRDEEAPPDVERPTVAQLVDTVLTTVATQPDKKHVFDALDTETAAAVLTTVGRLGYHGETTEDGFIVVGVATHSLTLSAEHKWVLAAAMRIRGYINQRARLREECLELALEISHAERNVAGAGNRIIDELADVLVMALQIREYIGPSIVDAKIDEKLRRLRSRMTHDVEW